MSRAPAWSRVLDRATGLAGLVVFALVADAAPWPSDGAGSAWLAWAVLPLVVLAGRRPLVLPTATAESLVIGLDSTFLVLLGLTLPFDQALCVWSASMLLGELTARRALDIRLFNTGVCILSGALALGVLAAVPVQQRLSPLGLGATVLAAAGYFLVDYVWSAVSVAAAEHASLRRTLRSPGLVLAFSCFLAVNSLGFLAAVILDTTAWAVGLLSLPFVSLVVATHSWSQLRRSEQQSRVLSTAAIALQHAHGSAEVEQLLLQHAATLVRTSSAVLADRAPEPGTSPGGLTFTADGRSRALVLAPRVTGEALSAGDLDALRVLLGVAEQATQRLSLHAELRRSALHDPLTGLANRTAFGEALSAAVDHGAGLAVLYCDLDGFKAVNDQRGHAAGDAVLIAAAQRLLHAVRPVDLAVRLGGDEFAVLLRGLPQQDPAPEAERIARRVGDALGAPYRISDGEVLVPASIGLCVRTTGDRPEDLLSASDAAMYAAKARGGGRIQLHPVPTQRRAAEQQTL